MVRYGANAANGQDWLAHPCRMIISKGPIHPFLQCTASFHSGATGPLTRLLIRFDAEAGVWLGCHAASTLVMR